MMTQARSCHKTSGWSSTLIGHLLFTLLLFAVSTPATPAESASRLLPRARPAAAQSAAEARTVTPADSRVAAPSAIPMPKAYVGLFKDNAIAVIDTGANRVLSLIPVPPGPHGLVITPDGRKVYVSSDGASTVSVIDTASDRVIGSIEVGSTPHGLAIAPDGRRVLVSGFGTNRAILIDTATDQVVGQIPVPQPHNSAISPDGRTAYVASQLQGATALVVLDLATMMQVDTVPLDKTPRALDYSPDGKRVYFTVAGMDAVQVLDTATGQIVAQIPVGASPHHPLFTPDGRLGLVVSQGPGTLEILDPVHNSLSGTVAVGKAPHWIATSADGDTAYVTNEASNNVAVVDLTSRKVTAIIPVGHAPRKLAVQAHPSLPTSTDATSPSASVTTPPAAVEPAVQASELGGVRFEDHGTKDITGQAELELEADDYYFAPTFLRGEPGQRLTLKIENESGTLHNLSIPALQLDTDIPPKGKVQVEVTFPPSGRLDFFCKFHTALGMNGAFLAGDATPQAGSLGAIPKANTGAAY